MKDKIKFIIAISLIVITMVVFINKKEGFHEDEIFSYGSSNYKYDNVYKQYGRGDEVNEFIGEKILKGNILQNIKYHFIDHMDETQKSFQEARDSQKPIWKTPKEANEYVSIQKEDIINYPMVYWNQLRDVHPPLFYFVVHTISILFFNNFSKYIIFIINIIFMVASCIIIKKIMELLNKKHLTLPTILLYGLSMGAISTVIFQRMYMMLTFFVSSFTFINLKICKNNYEIDKKTWIQLGIITILGFLAQYYFCIIAGIIALIIFINILKKKDKTKTIKYITNYIKIALIGLILFPASIYHIFFSYRGVSSFAEELNYFEKLSEYLKLVGYSFNIPIVIGLIITFILSAIAIYKLYKKENKHISEILILVLPIIIFIPLIAKIAPNLPYAGILRYIMCILPIISIAFLLLCDTIITNKKYLEIILTTLVLVISIYGFFRSEPMYLYKGYNKYLEIAENNKDKCFVYVGNSSFNHIQGIPEFLKYSQSMIINETQINYLENDEKLQNTNEFILSIKKYLGNEQILNEVLEKTQYTNYEILLDDQDEPGCIIYRIYK